MVQWLAILLVDRRGKAGFKGPYTRLNLVSIGVGKQYRGWGIAKGLISKIIERAKKFPNMEIYLWSC